MAKVVTKKTKAKAKRRRLDAAERGQRALRQQVVAALRTAVAPILAQLREKRRDAQRDDAELSDDLGAAHRAEARTLAALKALLTKIP